MVGTPFGLLCKIRQSANTHPSIHLHTRPTPPLGGWFYLASCTWVIFRASKKTENQQTFWTAYVQYVKRPKWRSRENPTKAANQKSRNIQNHYRKWDRDKTVQKKSEPFCIAFWDRTSDPDRQLLWPTSRGFAKHPEMGQVVRCQLVKVRAELWTVTRDTCLWVWENRVGKSEIRWAGQWINWSGTKRSSDLKSKEFLRKR